MPVIRLSSRLWKEYRRQARAKAAENRLRDKRQKLIVEHMPLAAKIARQVWHRFNHGVGITADGHAQRGVGSGYRVPIALEDMISCAYVGLVEAAGRWNPSRGDFAKYCYLRVRGAVVDAHRRQNYIELQHESLDAWLEGEARLIVQGGAGRDANDLGHRRAIGTHLRDPRPLPDELANRAEVEGLAVVAIDRLLPDDEGSVIRMALAGAGVAEIAKALGVSPAAARAKLLAARGKVAAALQTRAA